MSNNTVTILLVEDDAIDVQVVHRSLKARKIANPLVVAKDGIEALEHLRGLNGKEKITGPILTLVDLNMPRMNGIEFLTEVRKDEELRRLVAFVLTTSKSEEDKFKAYDLNVAGYIVKSEIGDSFSTMIDLIDCYWRVIEFP